MSGTSSINSIQEEIIDEFSFFDNWEDKYGYIIDTGKSLGTLPENLKTEDNLIKGCQSRVWLTSDYKDGKVYFTADSDAIIVKGLVVLLLRVYTGQNPADIITTDLHFLNSIGLQQHLSPTRSNGLAAMVKQIKMHAVAYNAKYNN